MRLCVIKDGKVINVVEIEKVAEWKHPEGTTLGPEGGEIGDSYDKVNDDYVAPVEPGPSELEKAQTQLNDLDMVLSRADEDIINVLIDKGIAELSDFGPILEKRYNDKAAARIRKDAADGSNPDEPVIILPD